MYSFKRPVDLSEMKSSDSGAHVFLRGGLRSTTPKRENCVSLLSANQVVRALPPNKVPLKEVYPKGQRSQGSVYSVNMNSDRERGYSVCLSLRCHPPDDGGVPGGDGSELQEGQIRSCAEVNTTHT